MILCFAKTLDGTRYQTSQRIAAGMLSLLLLISPFPHTQTIVEICFYVALAILVYLAIRLGVKFGKNSPLTILCFFGAWALLGSLVALDTPSSLRHLYSHFAKYLLLVYMLATLFPSRLKLISLGWVMVASGTIFSLIIFIYFYGILGHDLSMRLGEGLERWPINPMGFVILFSLALVFPLYRHFDHGRLPKIILIMSTIILMTTAILTQSRGTLIGLFLVLTISLFRNKKSLAAAILLLLIMVFGIFSFAGKRLHEGDKARVALILYTIEVIKDYPVAGIGFSLDTFKSPQYIDPSEYVVRIPEQYRNVVEFLFPHNIFLDVAVRTGLVGVILFGSFLVLLFMRVIRLISHVDDPFVQSWAIALLASLSMFVAKGMVEPVFMHFVEVIFYAILSMVVIITRVSRNNIGQSQ